MTGTQDGSPAGPAAPAGKPQGRTRRKRVVLADAGDPVTVLRTYAEIEEQTSVGEALVRNLISSQLKTALWLSVLVMVVLGGLPLAAYLSPGFAGATLIGVRLPWLLLGVLPFPLLFGVGYAYHRRAERHEVEFVRMVER